jgi:hypothetical protein
MGQGDGWPVGRSLRLGRVMNGEMKSWIKRILSLAAPISNDLRKHRQCA